MRYTPLLLLLFVISAETQRTYSQSCPVVVVTCPDSSIGSSLTFAAKVSGGDPSAKLTFNWTVSAGKIIAVYGDLTWAEERARLDKFADHLEPGITLRSHRKKFSRKSSNPGNRIN